MAFFFVGECWLKTLQYLETCLKQIFLNLIYMYTNDLYISLKGVFYFFIYFGPLAHLKPPFSTLRSDDENFASRRASRKGTDEMAREAARAARPSKAA